MISTSQLNFRLKFSIESLEKYSGSIYIYGNGGAGRWLWKALESLDIDVSAFIDSDVKKIVSNSGYKTISVSEAESKLSSNDLIIIGAVDIHDILIIKQQTLFKEVPWLSLGEVASELVNNCLVSSPTDFEKYSLDVVIDCHKRLLDPSDIFLRSVDLVITEKCSLKCKDCANLMQYYTKPQDGSVEGVIQSAKWLL